MVAHARMNEGSSGTAPDAKGAAAVANPIVSALHQMAVSVLSEQLREMFEKADDILFDSAEKARAGDEQRLYLDTMRIVRVQRARIIQAFQDSLKAALSGLDDRDDARAAAQTLDDMSQWSLQDGDALEERIAMSNMETKAASLHAHELVELQRRLARLADMSGGGMSSDSMSPARIVRAFQNSMRDVNVDFPIKLVIYKLFDRVVVGRLSEVFVGANQLLAVHGIEPSNEAVPQQSARLAREPVRGAAGPAAAGGAGSGSPAWAPRLDMASMGQLMAGFGHVAGSGDGLAAGGFGLAPGMGGPIGYPGGQAAAFAAAGASYSDGVLAHDVAQILSAYAQGRRPQAPAWLPPENVALVARMFDGYYRDPRLPDNLKPMLARLQMPVMKAALNDAQFFADTHHPVRRTVNDLFEMLLQFGNAETAPSPQMVSELQGLIEALVQAYNLDPSRLRASEPAAVDQRTAETFLREQEEQLQRKNRARVERVRRIVAHELRRRMGERRVEPGIMRLMLSGFGPLLCLDYIRNGIDGASWSQTMTLVDRVLRSLEECDGDAEVRAAEEAEIVAAITHRLAAIGFSEERLQEVVSGLLQAYLERTEKLRETDAGSLYVREPAVARIEAALSPEKELQGLLSILLVPGAWFTVWEPASQTKHWVRVKGYYPAQNSAMFGHYMEERFLRMQATAFATDLVEGRAAAIDPSPELQNAVARLSALPFARSSDPLVWIAVDGRPTELH